MNNRGYGTWGKQAGSRGRDSVFADGFTKIGVAAIPICERAAVAQLDRASDYGSEGWGFESSRPRPSDA